ncbi:hypothetical protein TSTA_110070 [Talaromyces stipitatus ATCC 10500]|uniref:Uncharacterized protein n=1 Tax=Talaromyces stipitatus (strain ATCC 10500 / CBS 375.48 / QM 6759 / NRRL 1006) TaxID=441959 RepID=B8MUY6_TALSN|nr:uncharacterized protein TSTA_110070 [Talaromyces stipitatus ATCC 10500]EED11827.1 hypothetical protein TSTA_110070 [Talaromyces stipitatus ATCC 10500]
MPVATRAAVGRSATRTPDLDNPPSSSPEIQRSKSAMLQGNTAAKPANPNPNANATEIGAQMIINLINSLKKAITQ